MQSIALPQRMYYTTYATVSLMSIKGRLSSQEKVEAKETRGGHLVGYRLVLEARFVQ